MKDIENSVKEFIIQEYKNAQSYAQNEKDVVRWRHGASTVLQFSLFYLFPCYNKNLVDWWENEMWEKFNELALDKRKHK